MLSLGAGGFHHQHQASALPVHPRQAVWSQTRWTAYLAFIPFVKPPPCLTES